MKVPGLQGITFQQIEIFLAAAKYENFTKVAELLHMTQASVSRNILSMENALGLVLFVRHKKRVILTNAGRSFAKDLETVVSHTENALDNAFLQQQNQFKNLVIGDISSTSMDEYLLPIVREFEKRNPSVELIIKRETPKFLVDALISGECDASFFIDIDMPDMLSSGNFQNEMLLHVDPCIVLSDTHPLYYQEDISLDELREQPLVAMRDGMYSSYWKFVHDVCQEVGLNYQNAKFVANESTLAMELKRSNRIAIMDRFFAPMDKAAIRYIPLENCRTKSGVTLLYSKNNSNAYLTQFRAVCKEFTSQQLNS